MKVRNTHRLLPWFTRTSYSFGVNTVYMYVRFYGPTIFTTVCTLCTVKCACYSNVIVLDVHVHTLIFFVFFSTLLFKQPMGTLEEK